MTIALDAMGSDLHPQPELQAAIQSAELFGEEIILVGKEDLLRQPLELLNKNNAPVRIVHAPEMIDMRDHPVEATKQKPENSMAIGLNLVKTGEARAFITAGNTGGAYFNAMRILRWIDGISRPALTTLIPTKNGKCVFIDMGANADCRPEFFLEFALMGSVFSEKVMGINYPRIATLANGEEEEKGNQLIKDSHPLLKNSGLNFIGNIEPRDVFAGHTDVVITDGFTGNIFIKTSEAVAKFINDFLKEEISSNAIQMLGGLLIKPSFKKLFMKMDPSEVGAGLLLGVNGYVFIGHGRSDARALISAIKLARQAADAKLLEALCAGIRQVIQS